MLVESSTSSFLLPLPTPKRTHSSTQPSYPTKKVWINPALKKTHRRHNHHHYLDRSIDMGELLSSLSRTSNPAELHAVMSPFVPADPRRPLLSPRFMTSLLSREPDFRRSLAVLDWMLDVAAYPPSLPAYNVVIRNALRAGAHPLALGLLHELRSSRSLRPDRFTYSSLVSSLARAGLTDPALALLPLIDSDRVAPDLFLLTSLIGLARSLRDHSMAVALFSRLRRLRIAPDAPAVNSLLHSLSRSGLLRPALRALSLLPSPDTVSYSTLLSALVSARRFLLALSLFDEMRAARVPLDLTVCNIMLHAYGRLDMPKEADRLFWSLRSLGLPPGVVTYNTMLRIYGDSGLLSDAVRLFRLMSVPRNVVTYNTMMRVYGRSSHHDKAANLLLEMRRNGVEPNAVTYSTIISIWSKAGRLDRAAALFQKLRTSGADIDPVLYQTMIVAYERAGLVAHARRLVRELRHPECVSRETAVAVLAKAGRVEEAAWAFRQAEVKDISTFRSMIDLFARNRRHKNVAEVYERMRAAGFFPDSETIAAVLNAYGKMGEFGRAEAIYGEMEEEGCVFDDRVHFQMMSLMGAKRDFGRVESIFEKLDADPDVDKKELHLVAANVYERANKLDEAARIIARISKKSSNAFA